MAFVVSISGFNGAERHKVITDCHALFMQKRHETSLPFAMQVAAEVIECQRHEHPLATTWVVEVDMDSVFTGEKNP